uniref:Uncharacterized protein n=1 Tax=Cajanus cajan TaxID=3821 RepID=A0A151TAZ5_CAJCA|nr:hypothetical protein KK1_018822 [Cajanus cajan]
MGGCCCSARKPHLQGAPVCYYCPPTFEERESLTSNDGTNASRNAGFLVGLNLEGSMPDTFQPPPVPLPYDTVLGGFASTDSESGRETVSSFETLITREDADESDCKAQANSAPTSPRKAELSKSNVTQVLVTEEEDVCPICLEDDRMLSQQAIPFNHCYSSSNESTPRGWPSSKHTDQADQGKPIKVMPDFAQVYSFIGSVFDPKATNHLQTLKQMDPINVETVLLLMRNLSTNLRSPEFENDVRFVPNTALLLVFFFYGRNYCTHESILMPLSCFDLLLHLLYIMMLV